MEDKIPIALDVSVTNYCNAGCDFCGFSKNRTKSLKKQFLDAEMFITSLPMLWRSGVRFVNFQGGEPLLHPEILRLVQAVHQAGMKADLITNGWKLPEMAKDLMQAGLHCLFISLDSENIEIHEKNRELKGLGDRLQKAIREVRSAGIPVIASVTVSKLVTPSKLPGILEFFGFSGVTFSYPRQKPFDSSSRVYGANSACLAFQQEELDHVLTEIKSLKRHFPTLNPSAGIEDIRRHILGQSGEFPCIGGFKYYYLDWELNLWRCEAWDAPFGRLGDFKVLPVNRDHCTSCMLSCYRDTSVLMYAPLSCAQIFKKIAKGEWRQAAEYFLTSKFYASLKAGMKDGLLLWQIFHGGRRRKRKEK